MPGVEKTRAEARRVEAKRATVGSVSFPEESTQELSSPAQQPMPPAARPHLARGTCVGRYLLLHPVGEGGMGVVYAAYDPELDRKVALKLLRPLGQAEAGHQGQARLLREAQALARISHPHVVPVYDAGTHGEHVFLTMELVEGTTLKQWLEESPRPWRQVLEVLVAAGRGLAAVHATGLVHRDFKPSNVLLGRGGRVLITDFGLARLAGEAPGAAGLSEAELRELSDSAVRHLHSPLTQAGRVAGTSAYMSPEQYQGRPTDARSDQFSFCVTLYQALYGQRAFEPRDMVEALRRQARADTTTTQGPRPALVAPVIREPPARPRVPRRVRQALLRGLSLESSRRFGSMQELLAELEQPLAPTRHRWWAALVATSLVLAAGVSTYMASRWSESACSAGARRIESRWSPQRQQALRAAFLATGRSYAEPTWEAVRAKVEAYARSWGDMYTQACLATRVREEQSEQVLTLRMGCLERSLYETEALADLLERVDARLLDKSVDMAHSLPPLGRCADVAWLLRQEAPPQEPRAQAELQRLGAALARVKMLEEGARYAQGLEQAREVVAGARQLGWRPLLAEALFLEGLLHVRLTELEPAEQALSEAVWLAESSRSDEVQVRAANRLATLMMQVSPRRPGESALWARLARAALERLGSGHDDLEAELTLGEASRLCQAERCGEAQEMLERALARVERSPALSPLRKAWLLTLLAASHEARSELRRASELYTESLKLSERVRGKAHPGTILARFMLAQVLSQLGQHEQALDHARQSYKLTESALGPAWPTLGGIATIIGDCLVAAGRPAEALAELERALALKQKTFGPAHPSLGRTRVVLGHALLRLERPAEALAHLERVAPMPDQNRSDLADAQFFQAQALVALRREPARARKLAEQALEGYRALGRAQRVAEVEQWLGEPQPR
jgi:eukaryotic-like serine/threonine-protein kinase